MARENSEKSSNDDGKEKIKALRQERSEIIERNKEILKKQNNETGLIKKGLKEGSKTIPELAKETGLKSELILYYVSTMKKFGEITEAGHAGGYFRYSLVEKKKADKK
ncbi:MAG: winged helix-turn-helix domain-containing protein [Deltaproteobacteria bacterium]|nr:winged helix-turn-helix domain-containing protein [Deltaproteobacteria bacterium]